MGRTKNKHPQRNASHSQVDRDDGTAAVISSGDTSNFDFVDSANGTGRYETGTICEEVSRENYGCDDDDDDDDNNVNVTTRKRMRLVINDDNDDDNESAESAKDGNSTMVNEDNIDDKKQNEGDNTVMRTMIGSSCHDAKISDDGEDDADNYPLDVDRDSSALGKPRAEVEVSRNDHEKSTGAAVDGSGTMITASSTNSFEHCLRISTASAVVMTEHLSDEQPLVDMNLIQEYVLSNVRVELLVTDDDGHKRICGDNSCAANIIEWKWLNIQTSPDAIAILSLLNEQPYSDQKDHRTDDDGQGVKPRSWDDVGRAVEERIMELHLLTPPTLTLRNSEKKNKYSPKLIAKLYLTKRAYETCHPSYASDTNSTSSNALIRGALGEIFASDSYLDPSVFTKRNTYDHRKRKRNQGDGQFGTKSSNGDITAKMIYEVIDNSHAKDFQHDEFDDDEEGKKDEEGKDDTDSNADSENNKNEERKRERLKISGLVPELRLYQEAAVRWMLRREKQQTSNSPGSTLLQNDNTDVFNCGWEICWVAIVPSVLVSTDNVNVRVGNDENSSDMNEDGKEKNNFLTLPLHQWRKMESIPKAVGAANSCNQVLITLYCPYMGWLVRSYEEARIWTLHEDNTLPRKEDKYHRNLVENNGGNAEQNFHCASGGILAESMGLGKTVEVLACILANQCPPDQHDGMSLHRTEEMKCCSTKEKITGEEKRSGRLVTKDNVSPKIRYSYSLLMSKLKKWFSRSDHTLICFCGHGGCNKVSLSWIFCEKCMQPMHGSCAGFDSEEQLQNMCFQIEKTDEEDDDIKNHTHNEYCVNPRLCSKSRCPICVTDDHSSGHGGFNNRLIKSRATLIITPPSILGQWEREIRKHTAVQVDPQQSNTNSTMNSWRPLKVLIYPGVKEICNNRRSLSRMKAAEIEQRKTIHAHNLADADIVLMTFESLMGDLVHCGSHNPRVGASKKYRVIPSPLTNICWWRICLDEAQRVETPTAASAKMALNLVSRHRWCVTGTPISKGKLEDLFGLLLFLNVRPFGNRKWFHHCLASSDKGVMDRIRHLLHDIMWRSTKANVSVKKQMGVPEQVEIKHLLQLSSIEKHFYEKTLEETILAASTVMAESTEKKVKGQKARDIENLSFQLHRLRAACCHPQVGSSGIGKPKKKVGARGKRSEDSSYGVASRVLSMDQILDRLIDDAKTKAENAQRDTILHTNAFACLSRLKCEAKVLGLITCEEQGVSLLKQSCSSYFDALHLTDENASPCPVIGEAEVHGCNGFQFPKKIVRNGRAILIWKVTNQNTDGALEFNPKEVWSKFDFNGPAKRICSILVRPLVSPRQFEGYSEVEKFHILTPKKCVLQVSNAAIGGMFVDALPFTLSKRSEGGNPLEMEWEEFSGFRANRSKIWRITAKTYHKVETFKPKKSSFNDNFYVGIEIQLMEPDIVADNLQRLHILHNAALALSSLQQAQEKEKKTTPSKDSIDMFRGMVINDRIKQLQLESTKIESLYMEAARVLHKASKQKFREASNTRQKVTLELISVTERFGGMCSGLHVLQNTSNSCWWQDLLALYHLYGTMDQQKSLYDYVKRALFDFCDNLIEPGDRSLPPFENLDGLNIAINLRIEESSNFFYSLQPPDCIRLLGKLSPFPTDGEIYENTRCHKCRKDWDQRGPLCRLCKIENELLQYQKRINDKEIDCVLRSMANWVRDHKDSIGKSVVGPSSKHANFLVVLDERANKFFEVKTAAQKEINAAKVMYKAHFNLLSDIDELNQCKRSMQLLGPDELTRQISSQESPFFVKPFEIAFLVMDHNAKQAMAMGNLRRSKDTLRYLKNQNIERNHYRSNNMRQGGCKDNNDVPTCIVCLCAFEGERAVLRCGHMFHYSPCLERMMTRGDGITVSCPMRCALRTKKEDVLIATDKQENNVSKINKEIKGCWGTKVDRIVADVLEVTEVGNKSIIFSQWDDMLDVIDQALQANNIAFVRPKAKKKFGECIKLFRSSHFSVLLMNIKNGAEGLTLVEASHVFMVEPLLNYGMDSQAINRIHRIGQKSKTYVHRYIVEDTIELKIDKMRMARQENFQDSAQKKKKHRFRAGGLDGGFDETELQDLLK